LHRCSSLPSIAPPTDTESRPVLLFRRTFLFTRPVTGGSVVEWRLAVISRVQHKLIPRSVPIRCLGLHIARVPPWPAVPDVPQTHHASLSVCRLVTFLREATIRQITFSVRQCATREALGTLECSWLRFMPFMSKQHDRGALFCKCLTKDIDRIQKGIWAHDLTQPGSHS